MASQPTIPPIPPTAFVDPQSGRLTREAYRYLFQLNQKTAGVTSGDVATPPGSGLAGGGSVADGVSLSIANNGVTNGMLRQSVGCSVVGRYANSPGSVSDIQAVQNDVVLTRSGNQLAFRPSLDGIPVGESNAAPSVTTELLIVSSVPPANAAAPGAEGTITWDSGFLYVCVTDDVWKRVAIATW